MRTLEAFVEIFRKGREMKIWFVLQQYLPLIPLYISIELVELHTKIEKMTNSLPDQLNLLLKVEAFFDNVHKDIKGLIKTRKDLLTQAIEKENEMDEEERLVYHELFVEESKSLIQSLQDVNALLKQQNRLPI